MIKIILFLTILFYIISRVIFNRTNYTYIDEYGFRKDKVNSHTLCLFLLSNILLIIVSAAFAAILLVETGIFQKISMIGV